MAAWAGAGAIAGVLAAALLPASARAAVDTVWGGAPDGDASRWALDGDVGAGAVRTGAVAPGARDRTRPIPYVYADAGPLFAREDTFGVKLLPLGDGALELVARDSTEGGDADGPGLAHRRDPRPVGLGTFQETPWGGVFVDAFVDTVSGGTLLEASYAAELHAGPLTLYPQLGMARRDARYVGHLAGTASYRPGPATTPVLGLSAELPVAPRWTLVGHVQRERFDRAIDASPRVDASGRTTLLLALARHFG